MVWCVFHNALVIDAVAFESCWHVVAFWYVLGERGSPMQCSEKYERHNFWSPIWRVSPIWKWFCDVCDPTNSVIHHYAAPLNAPIKDDDFLNPISSPCESFVIGGELGRHTCQDSHAKHASLLRNMVQETGNLLHELKLQLDLWWCMCRWKRNMK